MLAVLDQEIIYQATIGSYRLSANTAGTGQQVISLKRGHVTLQLLDVSSLDIIAIHLAQTHLPVASGHAPEAAEAEHAPQVAGIDLPTLVALACKGQHRVWTGPDFAVGPACEMHAQKGKTRIGYRINQGVHHMTFL